MNYSACFTSCCCRILLFGLMISGTSAFAINEPTIGDFNGELEPESLDGGGDTYGFMSGGLILGGLLDVEVSGTATAEATESALTFVASDPVIVTWDGEDESEALDPFGLGNQNLTEEEFGFTSQDAFRMSFSSVSTGGSYLIEVYTEEEAFSTFSGTVTPATLSQVIPYSSFVGNPLGDPAEFSQVGAIRITFSGGLEGELDQFETTQALGGMTMVDALLNDVNSNSLVDPGDTIRYTITIPAASSGTGVVVGLNPAADTPLVVGSVTTTDGSVTTGNTGGDTSVSVTVGVLPATDVVITVDCLIAAPLSGGSPVCNQATLTATGGASLVSDDPDDPTGADDFTCTPIFLDTEDPVLTLPSDTQVANGDDTTPASTGTATATDNVTASPVITFVDSVEDGPLPYTQRISRTWTAEDEAGNTSSGTQFITVTGFGPAFALGAAVPDRPVLGLFSPAASSTQRQLGQITVAGDVSLLGTSDSLSTDDITMASGITAFNRQTQTVYTIGQTSSDGFSRIFSVDRVDGSSTSAVLSAGTASTVVGIWYDEENTTLYGVFQVGAGLGERQLATIDPDTGTVAFLGTATSVAGSIGGSLTGDSDSGTIYFLGTTGGIPGSLFSVDLTTGAMTATALSGANYNAISGMEFSVSQQKLYALLFSGSERRLAEVSPSTGVVTPLGSSTVGGGGVSILTYSGVNTIEEYTGTFLFVGRYNNGTSNIWAIWGVDLATGGSSFNDIDTSLITTNGYYGLEYANLRLNAFDIVAAGPLGSDFVIDMANGTDDLVVTSSDDLILPFTTVSGVTETNDGGGQPNRFLIPAASINADKDFFRVEIE